MKRFDRSMTILFAAAGAALACACCDASDRNLKKAAGAITEETYRAQVQAIAADELEGRSPGTPGEQRTVEYLEKQFLDLGLQPAAAAASPEVALVEITPRIQLSFARGPVAARLSA
jgi:hypothetical protein